MLKFDSEKHQYYMEIPSVTQIIRSVVLPNQYDGVPQHILDKAAEWGTAIHDAIERDSSVMLDEEQTLLFNSYKKLVDEHHIKIIKKEQMVFYDGEIKYAGTYDCLADILGAKVLIDIKTTYKLDLDYLSYQLSFYAMAIPEKIDALYVIWLPKKGKAQFIKIDRVPDEILKETLKRYKESIC